MRPYYSDLSAQNGLTVKPPVREYAILPPLSELFGADAPQVPEQAWRVSSIDKSVLKHDLRNYLSRDIYPLPVTEDREGYHRDRHLEYWCSGLLSFLELQNLYEKYSKPLADGDTFFDFGCATCRVLLHAVLRYIREAY